MCIVEQLCHWSTNEFIIALSIDINGFANNVIDFFIILLLSMRGRKRDKIDEV